MAKIVVNDFKMKTLDILFDQITKELREEKPLSSLKPYLEKYTGVDWKPYKFFSPNHYTRHVLKINDVVELVIICWEVNQGCPIHDHPVNGCLVRILQGEVRENTYELKDHPVLLNSRTLKTNGVIFQQGNLIGHEIINNSDKRATSLHIYSPPNYKPNFY
jgi:cysteine dioxygenase